MIKAVVVNSYLWKSPTVWIETLKTENSELNRKLNELRTENSNILDEKNQSTSRERLDTWHKLFIIYLLFNSWTLLLSFSILAFNTFFEFVQITGLRSVYSVQPSGLLFGLRFCQNSRSFQHVFRRVVFSKDSLNVSFLSFSWLSA